MPQPKPTLFVIGILLALVAGLGMEGRRTAHAHGGPHVEIRPTRSAAAPDRSPDRAGQVSGTQVTQEATQMETLRDRGPEFPHLLVARGQRPEARRPEGARPLVAAGNAAWDPDRALPPSVLPRHRRERAAAMLEAPDAAAWKNAFRAAAAFPGDPDTVRILALRIDFANDSAGDRTTGDGRFDLRSGEEAARIPIDPPPHDKTYFERHLEAVARYYRVMSGGAIELVWEVWPEANEAAYTLPDTRKYGPWIFSNSNPDILQHAINFVGDALAAAGTDASLDFSRFWNIQCYPGGCDTTMSVVLFHAGADFQGDMNRDTPWDIPSFNLYVEDPFVVQDSIGINLVMVVPESVSQDGFHGALNGVLTHEYGHQLGFADLYDVRVGLPVVGMYSLMDSGDNLYAQIEHPSVPGDTVFVRGMLPSSLDPWHKALFFPEGVRLIEVEHFLAGDSTRFETTLPAVQMHNDILYIPLNLAEYLLIENRQWDLNGDSEYPITRRDPGTGVIMGPAPADTTAGVDDLGWREYDHLLHGRGVLMWHIDQNAIAAGLNTPYGGVNIFFGRPGVKLVEADGIRDIGTASPEFLGGPYDPYFVGGYTCLGPDTRPASHTNDGTPTGMSICVLDSSGVEMRIAVDTGANPAGWPRYLAGDPTDEQMLALDLDGSGSAEILVAAGRAILGWLQDGTPIKDELGLGELFIQFASPIDHGLAGREDFRWGTAPGEEHRGPLVAAVAGGALWLMDGRGSERVAWPSREPVMPPDSLVTATPVVLDSLVLAGCADGTIRGVSSDPERPVVVRFPVADGAIRALGAGAVDDGGELIVVWATEQGEAGAFRWSGRAADAAASLFSDRHDRPARLPASVLAAPAGPDGAMRFLFQWSDGTLEWREADGTLMPGWPVSLGAPPAGAPIVADADGDGRLETVAADAGGWLHVLGWNGVEEYHWPKRIWSEDDRRVPEQLSGPRVLDIDGDGRLEILLYRADGMLLALDGQGRSLRGWPRSSGTWGTSGPLFVPAGGGYGARLFLSSLYGRTGDGRDITALTAIRVPAAQDGDVGTFATAGFDGARTRVYPRRLLPEAVSPGGDFADGSLRIYPNPLREEAVTVRFVLGRPARVSLDAFDLSGRRVASAEGLGDEGLNGNQLRWDLSGLGSGLYQIRFRVQGDGFQREVYSKLAVIR